MAAFYASKNYKHQHRFMEPGSKPDARRAAPALCDDSGRGAAEAQSWHYNLQLNNVERMVKKVVL
ncbi:hypothetical protein J6590_072383 [Homalodisca vitripennis]|nr:hypothetical protein J6590_072383 [Homalodisca vitripennis]